MKSDDQTRDYSMNSNSFVGGINRDLEEKAVMKTAQNQGLPYINLTKIPLNPDFLKVINVELSQKARSICFFKSSNHLRIAVEDPNNNELLGLLNNLKQDGYKVEISLASPDSINEALKFYFNSDDYIEAKIVKTVDESKLKNFSNEVSELHEIEKNVSSLTSDELLNRINIIAINAGATDVHFEPGKGDTVIRFRIDGLLYQVMSMSNSVFENLKNQIKYVSKIQMNLVSVPQDGRYSFEYNSEIISVRVATIPTNHGESFVCRLLRTPKKTIDLEELGFRGHALKKLENVKNMTNGLVLCTGPTGSGKSTTLYSLLGTLNSPTQKIITLEDPIEYSIDGVTQSQVNEKRGYTFAEGLKTILRQDPDVVMVGEIRDLNTAQAVIQASLTGHVVLSTLHTNSALDTMVRLKNMGLDSYMIAPALDYIIAQRLVRKVCKSCSKMRELNGEEQAEFEKILLKIENITGEVFENKTHVAEVIGCKKCSDTGYKGRSVIAEVFKVNEEITRLILEKASTIKIIEAIRKQGFITMIEDGYSKVSLGITTFDEVKRVSNLC